MAVHAGRLMPAIVLGRGHTGLGALRSLVLAGVPTYVACPSTDLVTSSRWYRPVPGPRAWDGTVGPCGDAALRDLPLDEAVLLPGADDAALWLADVQRSGLAGRFRVSSSSREILQILQDKTKFGEFLASSGIPHPRTFTIASRADIDALPFEELDRMFLKPADSQSFSQITGAKGIWVKTRTELEDRWSDLHAQGHNLLAQEYVPGNADDHYFIDGFRDRNGALPGLFARRRLRIHPSDFGNSSYCESVPLGDVSSAVASLTELLAQLRYRGIFSAEFKRDARDGKFRLLEVNTRAWWYVEFAARCGVNVCRMAYEDANERPVPPVGAYAVGAGCVNLMGDIRSALRPGARAGLLRTLRQWACAHKHVFRAEDPRPGLSVLSQNLQLLLANAFRRATS